MQNIRDGPIMKGSVAYCVYRIAVEVIQQPANGPDVIATYVPRKLTELLYYHNN